jgi:hypothetical protein
MSRMNAGTSVRPGLSRKWVVGLSLAFIALAARPGQAQQEPLAFFKNYFITGDYVVRGTSVWRKGVNGKAVVDIAKLGGADGVTPDADIVAAFLYIQTAERTRGSGIDHVKFGPTPKTGKPFLGNDFGPFYAPGSTVPGSGSIAKALNWDDATLPCWSILYPGGGRRLVTYRTDVLRFLPIDPKTGKQALNTSLRVMVPDSGIDFDDDDEDGRERADRSGPRAVGVSLVVVYRDAAKPFKAVVLYDGGFTKRAFATMTQTLQGFYDASSGSPVAKSAKMTHIVGDGRPFLSERVKLNGTVWTNPFKSADGAKWDNWTTSITLPDHAASAALRVEPLTLFSDCVSWSAIVLSTNVQDTDGDGLLDAWEMDPPPIDVSDPTDRRLPNLAQMGASPHVKDLFVEVGYMETDRFGSPNAPSPTYGGVIKPPHTHLPAKTALNLAGDAFLNAPVPIKVHFDVGDRYQDSPYVIPAAFARGGEAIVETACDATDPKCQYPAYPGTVGWKRGFRFLRDQILSEPLPPHPPMPGDEDQCDLRGNSCVRRFDDNRHDMFRYALFAHFLGLPVDPCLKANGSADAACQTDKVNHPGFSIPRTNSGIADFPGGDLLVTLGGFDDSDGNPVGTPFMQGSTLLHELGHTFLLTHAGPPQNPREPNCKPNYLSSMNYLFQLRGLPDHNGAAQMDFSREALDGLDETALRDGPLTASLMALGSRYRTGWYAPQGSSYLKNAALGVAPALKHCDGSDLKRDAQGNLTEPAMVRVDAPSITGPIDWNANGDSMNGPLIQDINFDGTATPLNAGADDWAHLFLNQIGSRRNVGGIFPDPAANGRLTLGPLSLDVGRSDIGRSDIGRSDIGRSDIGRSDIGRSDIGSGDLGQGDTGRSDIGRSDIGRSDIGRGLFGGGDLDVGGANEPFGEIDLETAKAVTGNAPTPPDGLQACLANDGRCASEGGGTPVLLNWQAPHVGKPIRYHVYRVEFWSETFQPGNLPTASIGTVATIEGVLPTTFLDYSAWPDAKFAYFVIAEFDDFSRSGISNFATVTTPPAPDPPLSPSSALPVCGDQDNPFDELDPLRLGAECVAYRPLSNLQLYEVPAGASQLKADFVYRGGVFNNELAVFKVDDATGAVDGLHPGDQGYLAAVYQRARVVFASGADASAADVVLSSLPVTGAIQGGDRLAFFLVQDGSLAALMASNPGNTLSASPRAFFSINSLNPDLFDHLAVFERSEPASTEFGFEDLTSGGDSDFDDMVFTVRVWNP